MHQSELEPGYEVSNSDYGRGVVLGTHPESESDMASASVYFYYPAETKTVPLVSLKKAKENLSIHVREGTHGFEIEIHDGMFAFYITPDGEGTGYEFSLKAGNAQLDDRHLSTAEVISTFDN